MGEPATKTPMSLAEFLIWEQAQPLKHEFVDGETFAMTGARQAHLMTAGNIFSLLKAHLRGGPCRAWISDMQLAMDVDDAAHYPDVSVSCDPRDLAAERTIHHPRVLVEVLSESTAAFDRGAKFASYGQIPELTECVLIDPDRRAVEIFRRTDSGDWLLATRDGERGLILPSIDFEAPLDAVFEDLDELANAKPG